MINGLSEREANDALTASVRNKQHTHTPTFPFYSFSRHFWTQRLNKTAINTKTSSNVTMASTSSAAKLTALFRHSHMDDTEVM